MATALAPSARALTTSLPRRMPPSRMTSTSRPTASTMPGNNLDGTPATIRLLPGVVDAVGDQIEVLMDGGIRRGSDVVKALALGARAVLIGRAYLWGMAANGEAGVSNVLQILRQGIDSALLGLGKSSIHELSRDDLVIPADFTRSGKI